MASCSTTTSGVQFGDYRVTAFAMGSGSSSSSSKGFFSGDTSKVRRSAPKQLVVRTTAYTHTEADSIPYGRKNATGSSLKFGNVRSAAADWSRFPVGTRFKIKGLPYEYVVDDYGSALVGTDTIDLYKPSEGDMDNWGARNVGIEVLEWGSFAESMRILETRQEKAKHVRQMLHDIKRKIGNIPVELQEGFKV